MLELCRCPNIYGPDCKSLSLHILLLWVFQVVEGEGEAVEEEKVEEEAAPEPEKAE